MTTHARGAVFLEPRRAPCSTSARCTRARSSQRRARQGARYKMTSQCASGSGQFLENIARYLGVALEEIGSLSLQGDNPEKVSRHLRGAGRDRRHQHGVARHHGAQHPQGHPRVDGRPLRQAAA
jgi:hypothetical protein